MKEADREKKATKTKREGEREKNTKYNLGSADF